MLLNQCKNWFIMGLLATGLPLKAQSVERFADSIRARYRIPELAYAVISGDSIFEMRVSGVQRINSEYTAKPSDRFHIGSNTKAITAFLCALAVDQKKLGWDTRFFDLFPELQARSRKAYRNITLQDLLTFRATLPPYTYSFKKPGANDIKGPIDRQRYLLAGYFLSQKPMKPKDGLTPSNAGYILAGLMLEKATAKPYKALVADFGNEIHADFGFDEPNLTDVLQPWGHDFDLKPLPPAYKEKLNWLLFAGNINVSLPDYARFIQLQIKGLNGTAKLLSPEVFQQLLYGFPGFSFGWFNATDEDTGHKIAFNEGNAGAFITKTEIIKETGKAYIVFANASNPETEEGIAILLKELKLTYGQ